MKTSIKLSAIAICALNLSGCALTNGVLQGAYDNKADSECRLTSAQGDSIHRAAKTSCSGGAYVPRDEITAEDLEPNPKEK